MASGPLFSVAALGQAFLSGAVFPEKTINFVRQLIKL
jgi:hypothetical protein